MSSLMIRAAPMAAALLVAACTSAPPAAPPPAPDPPAAMPPPTRTAQPLTARDAAAQCPALAQKAPAGAKVAQAELIATDIAFPVNWVTRRIEGKALPEHCRLAGHIDGGAGDFELRLPTQWNGRLLYQGGGGGDSTVLPAIGRGSGAAGFENNALSRGFAVVSGNSRRAQDRAAAVAQALLQAYYGSSAARSYFAGCADGAADGLWLAQQADSRFDGIVAVAPALREADAAMAAAWTLQRFIAAAPAGPQRRPVLSRAFSSDELFTVAQAILKRCDALDGAADGLVQDMAACRFDPAVLACGRGKTKDCLSAPKLKALGEAMAGPRTASGKPLYVGWPWDPGIAGPGWRAWTLGNAVPPAANDARLLTQGGDTIGKRFAAPPDATLTALNFDFGRDPPRLQAHPQRQGLGDVSQLEALRRRDGKLLLVHGSADPVFSAWATVDYQRAIDAAFGAGPAAEFARTFVVPGMNHCAGGPATDRFDALSAVVAWAEQGEPPQRIEARGSAVLQDETRPLCPWPEVARYRGSGALNASASYECR